MKKTFNFTKAFRKHLHLSFAFPHKLLTTPNRFKVTSFFTQLIVHNDSFDLVVGRKNRFTQVGLEKCELLHICFPLPLKLHIDRGLCWNYFKAKNKPCLSRIGVNRMSFGGYSPPLPTAPPRCFSFLNQPPPNNVESQINKNPYLCYHKASVNLKQI